MNTQKLAGLFIKRSMEILNAPFKQVTLWCIMWVHSNSYLIRVSEGNRHKYTFGAGGYHSCSSLNRVINFHKTHYEIPTSDF